VAPTAFPRSSPAAWASTRIGDGGGHDATVSRRDVPPGSARDGNAQPGPSWFQVVLLWGLARPVAVLAVVAVVGVLVALEVVDSTWSPEVGDDSLPLACAVLLGGLWAAPLFTPPPPGRAVRPDVEPELTALVARVAEVVGIRDPVAVRVVPTADVEVVAVPARFGGGLLLVLGWPLLRRLTHRQLAAAVGHGFGLHAQASSRLDRALLSARADLVESLEEGLHVPRWCARRVLARTRDRAWALGAVADRTSVEVAGVDAARGALVEMQRTGIAFDLVLQAHLLELDDAIDAYLQKHDDTDDDTDDAEDLEDVYVAIDAMLADPQGRARVDEAAALAQAEHDAPALLTHPPLPARLAAVTAAGRQRARYVGGSGPGADAPVVVHEAAAIEAWCVGQLLELDAMPDPGASPAVRQSAGRGSTVREPVGRGSARRVADLGVGVVLAGLAGVSASLGWQLSGEAGRDAAAAEELEGALGVTVLCALVLLLWWGWRGLRYVVAAARPPSQGTAQVFWSVPWAEVPLAAQCWLHLGSGRWQRVMWHPVVEGVRGRVPVVVHGSDQGRRAVVVALDGVRLVPVGRLRRQRPTQTFIPWDDARLCGTDVVLPSGAVGGGTVPSLPGRTPILLAVIGGVAGALFGVSVGPEAVVPLALAVAAALVSGWALSAPVP